MKSSAMLLMMTLALACAAAFGQGADSTGVLVLKPKVAQYNYDAIPKDPLASAFFSATIPGSGQIYNKEYLRGIITAAGFYAGFFLTQYMLVRWDALNTDTVYFRETDKDGEWYGGVREVYATRPDDKQVGLPTEEKIVLGVSAASMAGFWVWGVIDSYRGAKRYNDRLFSGTGKKIGLKLDFQPLDQRTVLAAYARF